MLAAEQDTFHVTFWSADWTPWRALEVLAERWPGLCFDRTSDVRRTVNAIVLETGESAELVAEISAWEDPPRAASAEAAPVLSVDGFAGPLDWLLEMAQARKIDLARPVDRRACRGVRNRHGNSTGSIGLVSRAAELGRWGVWLVMAASLALLRSRLLLPIDRVP